MTSYQFGRYTAEYGSVGYYQGAQWALTLRNPAPPMAVFRSNDLSLYGSPFLQQSRFGDHSYTVPGGKTYVSVEDAIRDPRSGAAFISTTPRYSPEQVAIGQFWRSGAEMGLGDVAYIAMLNNGAPLESAVAARMHWNAFQDMATGVAIARGGLTLPGGPVAESRGVIVGGSAAVGEGIVYSRVDLNGDIAPYGGQAESYNRYLRRQIEHARDYPDADFEFTIVDRANPGVALDVAEHRYIQRLTGGVRASRSPLVSNLRDPVGPRRRPGLGLSEPRR